MNTYEKKKVVEEDKLKREMWTVDGVFFTMGLGFLITLVLFCAQLGLFKDGTNPLERLQEPKTLIKFLVLVGLVPGAFIGSTGGSMKAPSLLAVGLALFAFILLNSAALFIVSACWVVYGGDVKECDGIEYQWWNLISWCSPYVLLCVQGIILFVAFAFFIRLCSHWSSVSDSYKNTIKSEELQMGRQAKKKEPLFVCVETK